MTTSITATLVTSTLVPVRIFHIVDRKVWAAAVAADEYKPAAFEQDGFVHFSFEHQVAPVANARYRDESDLIVVEVDPVGLEVVVEDSYGTGEQFPHVYAAIPTSAALHTFRLVRDQTGDWTFSTDVPEAVSAWQDR